MGEDQKRFVDSKLQQLLENGSIGILDELPKNSWVSNIFLVPKKTPNQFRMILNLKQLNAYITYRKFKMDQIHRVVDMFRPQMWATSIDLVDAYSHLFVDKSHWSYLCFIWRGVLYHFKCLPQGLSSAPRIFTKVVQPIIALLRTQMIQIVIYIDDTILMSPDRELLISQTATTLKVFENCGFTINREKSQLLPSQKIEFLGFDLDSRSFTISLTHKKRSDIHAMVSSILSRAHLPITVRFLAKLIGKIVAVFPASDHAQLHYRILDRFKVKCLRLHANKWSSKVRLSPACLQEVSWWKNNIHSPKMSRSLHLPQTTCEIFTDASSHSWGGVFRKIGDKLNTTVQNNFSLEQAKLPINTKELIAIYYSLCSFKHLLHGQGILIHCDNVTAIACVKNKGCSHPLRDKLSRRIYDIVFECKASIIITYINTKCNFLADKLSREVVKSELTEWEIADCTFEIVKMLCECSLDIDLFASAVNHKLPRFASWTAEQGAEFVDAFTVHWTNFVPFLNPPFSLWSRVLRKLQEDRTALAIGLVPLLPNQPWFSVMLKLLVRTPILMPRKTARLMRLPWDKEKCHPLAQNLRFLLVHLSGNSCKNVPPSLLRFRNRLQNLPGGRSPKDIMIKLLTGGSNSVLSSLRIRMNSVSRT